MSDIIQTVQLQDPGSELVVLYDLEYSSGSFAHFFAGLDDDLTELQFRDSTGAVQTYLALPLEADGFDISSDGAYSRPEITVANIESVFKDAIGGLDFQDLIGKRLTRRTTLKKYLVGESNDSGAGNPPVEFPKIVYVIDRLKSKTIISATFELAAPFDLAGIMLPRRVVVGGACPWKYKGVNNSSPRGGCTWKSETLGEGTTAGGDAIYMNEYDEYIVPITISFSSVGSSVTKGAYYSTSTNIDRVNQNGSTTSISATNYWQAIRDQASSPTQPSDSDKFYWRRVRVYTTEVSFGTTNPAYTYRQVGHNTYILSTAGALWRAKRYATANTTISPNAFSFIEGAYWTGGDICGKRVTSCSLRFQSKIHATVSSGVAVDKTKQYLPFGGFPGAKQR